MKDINRKSLFKYCKTLPVGDRISTFRSLSREFKYDIPNLNMNKTMPRYAFILKMVLDGYDPVEITTGDSLDEYDRPFVYWVLEKDSIDYSISLTEYGYACYLHKK